MQWYKVRVVITVDLHVLAPDQEMAKELALEELTNEVMSDGVELINVKHEITEVRQLSTP